MKPTPFDYHDVRDVDEALALVAEFGDEAKVLAGGQSLVPLLNFRLAQPSQVIDLNRVDTLSYVRRSKNALRIGAMTRQATLEQSALVQRHWPLLPLALRLVGHAQIRNRGTVGGSVAHADPAAELPTAFACLDAHFHVRSKTQQRRVHWDEFFVTHLTTSLESDEVLVGIEVPPPTPRTGSSFVEFSRRHGDFALGGAAALITTDGTVCTKAAIAMLGAADTPRRSTAAEEALVGSAIDDATARDAARIAIADIAPPGDIHGSTEYRRALIETMVRRAILEAAERSWRE
jgi:carbon-monoxide dehydrogenase medium subunit/6-hydroxypseudooxynicotine dehydrogenase subunit alpha